MAKPHFLVRNGACGVVAEQGPALAAGIWTRGYKRAWRVAHAVQAVQAVQAGSVWFNTCKQFSIATPFGGWRDSP